VTMCLRHFLTGKLLNLNGKCELSEGLEDFHRENPEYIENKKKEEEKKKEKAKKSNTEPEVKGGKLETMAQKKAVDGQGQQQQQQEPPKEEKEKEDLFKTFLKRNEIVLATSLRENERNLSVSNVFLLRSKLQENYLVISKEKALLGDVSEQRLPFVDSDNFNKIFAGMNPLARVSKETSFGENGHMMFFTSVADEDISEIMAVKSLSFPLMKLAENLDIQKKSPHVLTLAENCLIKLALWVTDSKEKNIESIKSQGLPRRQKLLR
jgi:hypothetical protein